MDLQTNDFDYYLPPDRIAQNPTPRREDSRLMVLDRATQTIHDGRFAAIGQYLRPGDLLVANRSRVLPARLHGYKDTGGEVELLLLRALSSARWIALARPSRRLRVGSSICISGAPLSATLEERLEEGQWVVHFAGDGDVETLLRQAGSLPLPPYIQHSSAEPDRYQTVYADREGSVAAPTAGLHFSRELLAALQQQGVGVAYVTLHVGLGTFRPVAADRVTEHRMHAEWGEVPADVAERINQTRLSGGRIVAVGTTSTRLLESAVRDGSVQPFQGETDRFIYPGYQFGAIDALITNFHLPKSTLLMLVSALAGRDFVLRAYREAIERGYRFYSFGDAMLIL